MAFLSPGICARRSRWWRSGHDRNSMSCWPGAWVTDMLRHGLCPVMEARGKPAWLYGSGFPKSLDVSKALDKAAGAERQVVSCGTPVKRMTPGSEQNRTGSWAKSSDRIFVRAETRPATRAADRWQGWGTGLKPARQRRGRMAC